MISKSAKCSLCNSSVYDSDIDEMMFGLKFNKEKKKLELEYCEKSDKCICILCIKQILSTEWKHWVLDGRGTPLGKFI